MFASKPPLLETAAEHLLQRVPIAKAYESVGSVWR
jgi:hypothetical protein